MPMPIPLRTPDPVRRLAERFDRITPHWPHHQRLLALAVMYGYSSWEDLTRSCNEAAAPMIYDQDLLSDEARQVRWLKMAEDISAVLPLLLPEALRLVHAILPTMRRVGERPKWYEPNDVFSRALLLDQDVWWVSSKEIDHPMAPQGFIISNAVNLADVARERLEHRSIYDSHREFMILVPSDYSPEVGPQIYFRRGAFMEVQPVPMGDVLRNPKGRNAAAHLQEFFDKHYPTLDAERRNSLLAEWRAPGAVMRAMNADKARYLTK